MNNEKQLAVRLKRVIEGMRWKVTQRDGAIVLEKRGRTSVSIPTRGKIETSTTLFRR